ncbi:MA3 domain-containing protein [Actinidia rufa]|uniref:MA3 domain-containing protein n=1 Tax=Actinidia rufa TaxID=165716 RepID=A0A7J0EH08_9ERIC|nr:MA3 domain-containing protein [Actinidia rufa]
MMDLSGGHMSNEHQELLRSASEIADLLSVSPLEISTSPRTPRSPMSPKTPRSPKSPRSPKGHFSKHGSGKGSPLKNDRHSHSGIDGRPKKVYKGFSKLVESADDLIVDIPDTVDVLALFISRAVVDDILPPGFLTKEMASVLKDSKGVDSLSIEPEKRVLEDSAAKAFKVKAHSLILEYFLSGDITEKLITLSMDRKNRERGMASVLLSSLCFPADDVVNGFVMLIESADDTALTFQSSLRIWQCFWLERWWMKCWGGGGSSRNGWAIEEVKDKIGKLLEEFESRGDKREACHCIKELGMPFFHHEVVKKSLVTVMEKKNGRLWGLLGECFSTGLITMNQMMEGFRESGRIS